METSREAADSFFQRMARGDAAGGCGVSTLDPEDLDAYSRTAETSSDPLRRP